MQLIIKQLFGPHATIISSKPQLSGKSKGDEMIGRAEFRRCQSHPNFKININTFSPRNGIVGLLQVLNEITHVNCLAQRLAYRSTQKMRVEIFTTNMTQEE